MSRHPSTREISITEWRLRFQVGIGHRFGHALSLIQVSGFVGPVAATEEFEPLARMTQRAAGKLFLRVRAAVFGLRS
jgi:hypothetical protein